MLPYDFIIALIAAFGTFFLGLLTFYKNPRSATSKLFLLFTITLTVYIGFNYLALNQPSESQTLFWVRTIMAVALVINALFFLLVLTFPKRKFTTDIRVVIVCFILTAVLIPFTFTDFIYSNIHIVNSEITTIPGPGIVMFLIHTLYFLGGGFVILLWKLRHTRGLENTQIKYFLFGTAIMFLAIIVTNLLIVLLFNQTDFIGLLPIYILIFVSMVSYAIIRHRFLDINAVVARTVTYSILILVIGIIFALYLFLVGEFFFDIVLTTEQKTALIVLIILFILSFQYVQKMVQVLTDKVFYKDQYDSDELLRNLSLIMASNIELEKLTHSLLNELLAKMKINSGAFILIYKSKVVNVIHQGYQETPEFDEVDINFLSKNQHALIFDELDNEELKDVLRKYHIKVALYLRDQGDTIGLFILGDKLSGDIYSIEDIKVLKILAPEITVAIRNAESYEEIKQFNVTLTHEIEKATHDLQEANRRLHVLDKLKDDFVSIASHELRTPMTAIKSYLWFFLEDNQNRVDAKQLMYVQRAYTSTERLINLVNDMLNVSRIESGRLKIVKKPVNTADIIKEVVNEVQPSADENKLEVSFANSLSHVPPVNADPDKLKQVLLNLVGNSLKFTPEGGKIIVSLGLPPEQNALLVSVKDTGNGISNTDLPKLFKKFGTTDSTITLTHGAQSTGLGLYISKSIIEIHGGKIWAKSEGTGKGSTFSFTIPIQLPTDNSQESPPLPLRTN